MAPKRKYDQSNAASSIGMTIGGLTESTETATKSRKAAGTYLSDDVFSDFTIVCNRKHFKVHRCLISAHSKYLERCCAGGFNEAKKRKLTLEEDYLEAVERMIAFFYVWDHEDMILGVAPEEIAALSLDDPRPVTRLQINAYMCSIADKYEVPDLKDLALQKFKKAACDIHGTENALPVVQRAICTVFHHAQLSEQDFDQMSSVLGTLWTLGGQVLTETLSGRGMVDFIASVPEFEAFIIDALMSDSYEDIIEYCADCSHKHFVDRKLVTRRKFRCEACYSLKPNALEAWDSSSLMLEPFW